MPPEFAYVIDELLHVDYNDDNKRVYYSEIIRSIIDIRVGDKFIIALVPADSESDDRQPSYYR